ncbi:MBL fold metallo-hydrolase [Azohydromonas caseinilytica]|uniref:MBL fold metallo-hydrolase n=1 Tax=Azohydromonas caseinilytica TaxID=2728836 RepID=A0A848F7Z2_9BURK|nr:MBL fold metallo-hydrolase [Azohydromonas caseinilytica]NML14370.1 MBL fold metallo-hydrolase [Azohydromonas caseinilytica]
MTLPTFLQPAGAGVYAIDTGFQREGFDAAYLLVQDGRAAFIDTGTNHSVPRLLAALEALGLQREAVDLVIPTHVHLDHAGGVGLLMQALPEATLWAHPRGARHLIDPRVLYQGALAVYGAEEMERSYGRLVPVDAARVKTTEEGMSITLAGRTLRVLDTPGHARHHHCLWDEASAGVFTGDTFGLSYRELDVNGNAWVFPTSTPVQFEPDALRESVSRIAALRPERLYLTHFGAVQDVPRLKELLLEVLDGMVELGRRLQAAPGRHEALKDGLFELYLGSLRAHGCALSDAQIHELLEMDIELNAQGIEVWLDKEAKAAG